VRTLAGRLRRTRLCLIVTHLNPRSLALAALVTARKGTVIYMTDGGQASERQLTWARRGVRRLVGHRFDQYIAGSPGTRRHLVETFGVEPARIHSSYLSPLDVFRCTGVPKRYDVIIGGRDVWEKNHAFALAVCEALARRRSLHVAVFGELGRVTELDPLLRSRSTVVTRLGHLSSAELADAFSASQVFLMPSVQEPWGLALHEALRCGCVVVAAPAVTSAAYLGTAYSGLHVVDLDVEAWCDITAVALDRGEAAVATAPDLYSISHAADGIVAAVHGAAHQ
jgi:glycosyltransferase involved in cell wall biosynthesis